MSRSRSLQPHNPAFRKGELLPQWAIRDADGRPDGLRAALEGSPTVLVYLPRPASRNAHEIARQVARLDFSEPRLNLALLVPATARGPEVISLTEAGLKALVLQKESDTENAGPAPTVTFTDSATRILETRALRANRLARLPRELRDRLHAQDTHATGARGQTAPVLMIPEVLTREHCQRLVAYFESNQHHPSGVLDLSGSEPQWRPDPAVKSRRDLVIEDPALSGEIERAMATRVLPEIRKCFHYVVSHHEPFKLVRYDEGSGYFRPHRDNESADTRYRRFAMTLNLNTDDYDGGALNFPEFGPAIYKPPLGGAIVFSCSLLHEATDVTRGSRHVLLGFFYNPADGLTSETSRG